MNDVVFGFGVNDSASPKIAKMRTQMRALEQESLRSAQGVAKVGSALARAGISERASTKLLGGFSGGMGMGIMGLGAGVAGFAVSGLLAADERNVAAARDAAAWRQKMDMAREQADKARAKTAAGGITFAQQMRKFITRGGNMETLRDAAVGRFTSDATDLLTGETDVLSAPLSVQNTMRDKARKLAATGEISYEDAVKRLAPFGSGIGKVDLASELMLIRPGISRADADRQLYKRSSEMGNIELAGSNNMAVPMAQLSDLVSGRTTSAIRDNASDALSPREKAVRSIAEEAERTAQLLDAAAKAQISIAGFAKDMGMLVGMGDGSEITKKRRFQESTSAGK